MDVLQATELNAADISPLVTGRNQITHQLHSQEQDSFDRELKTTANKEILKGWAKILNRHCIEAGFHAKPTDIGDPSPSTKLRIDTILMMQSAILSFHRLEFDDDIFPRQNIMRKIYFICSQVCKPINDVRRNSSDVREGPDVIRPLNLYLPAMRTSSMKTRCDFVAKLDVRQ